MRIKIIALAFLFISTGIVSAQTENTDMCRFDTDCKNNELCLFEECKVENDELEKYIKNNYSHEALNFCKNNNREECHSFTVGTRKIYVYAECDWIRECKAGFRCQKGKCEPKKDDDMTLNWAEKVEMARAKKSEGDHLSIQEVSILKKERERQEGFLEIYKDEFSNYIDVQFQMHGSSFDNDALQTFKSIIDGFVEKLDNLYDPELQREGFEFINSQIESLEWEAAIQNADLLQELKDQYTFDIIEEITIANEAPPLNHIPKTVLKEEPMPLMLPKTGMPRIFQQITDFLGNLFRL